jgi:hypothetical protein
MAIIFLIGGWLKPKYQEKTIDLSKDTKNVLITLIASCIYINKTVFVSMMGETVRGHMQGR